MAVIEPDLGDDLHDAWDELFEAIEAPTEELDCAYLPVRAHEHTKSTARGGSMSIIGNHQRTATAGAVLGGLLTSLAVAAWMRLPGGL